MLGPTRMSTPSSVQLEAIHHPRPLLRDALRDTETRIQAQRRHSFALDEAMARLFISRMLNLTKLPIYVMHNEGNDVGRALAPFANSRQCCREVLHLTLSSESASHTTGRRGVSRPSVGPYQR